MEDEQVERELSRANLVGASRTSTQSPESSLLFLPPTTCLPFFQLVSFLWSNSSIAERDAESTVTRSRLALFDLFVTRTQPLFPEVREKYGYRYRYPLYVASKIICTVFHLLSARAFGTREVEFRAKQANPLYLRNKAMALATSLPYRSSRRSPDVHTSSWLGLLVIHGADAVNARVL